MLIASFLPGLLTWGMSSTGTGVLSLDKSYAGIYGKHVRELGLTYLEWIRRTQPQLEVILHAFQDLAWSDMLNSKDRL